MAQIVKQWHVYMIRCSDNMLYTWIAKNVEFRILQHNAGNASKYTRARKPVTLVYQEPARNHGAALSREKEIKEMTREKKIHLAVSFLKKHSIERFMKISPQPL